MIRRRMRTRRSRVYTENFEVSLTPLIDTALTLLIIFMVTTPMIHNAIRVDLPKGQSQEANPIKQELVVSVSQKGEMFFNEKPVSLETVGAEIKTHLAEFPAEHEQRVWVKIDKGNSCDTLVGLIDKIKFIGGVKDVAVATSRAA